MVPLFIFWNNISIIKIVDCGTQQNLQHNQPVTIHPSSAENVKNKFGLSKAVP
jgi:hypothetical protein